MNHHIVTHILYIRKGVGPGLGVQGLHLFFVCRIDFMDVLFEFPSEKRFDMGQFKSPTGLVGHLALHISVIFISLYILLPTTQIFYNHVFKIKISI